MYIVCLTGQKRRACWPCARKIVYYINACAKKKKKNDSFCHIVCGVYSFFFIFRLNYRSPKYIPAQAMVCFLPVATDHHYTQITNE